MPDIRLCLLVDDHPDARSWVRSALEEAFAGAAIVEAGSLAEARALADPVPDLAVIDLGLPDGSGLDLIEPLVRAGSEVVVATVFGDDEHLFRALQQGARGYVLKDHAREELASMLLGILDGRPPLSPAIASRLLTHFVESRPDAKPEAGVHGETAADAEVRLTAREREVLTLLAKGYTVRKVADLLGIAYYTAAGYAKAVYQKLNVSSRAEATLEANRRGYVSPD